MSTLILPLYIRIWVALNSLHKRLSLFLLAILSTTSLPASATNTIFDMFDKVADGADNSKGGLVKIAGAIGVALVIASLVLWVAKKKNPQISGVLILVLLAAGCILIGVDQFIKKGQATIGLNPVDI